MSTDKKLAEEEPSEHLRGKRINRRVLPGFGISMGVTLSYLGLVILLPLAAVFIRASGISWEEFRSVMATPQVISAFKVTFGISFAAAWVNLCFGLIVAWVIVRYRFPGRKWIDAFVDLPFALPTAVAGIALTALYAPNGWLGRWFYAMGVETAYSQPGIFIALTFVGLPFVVRTVQPVIEDLDMEVEEASASLGASRLRTWRKVIFPALLPALITGFTLSFARAIGEYGSVIFISGNMPMKTEIVPLVIVKLLEQYQYPHATAVASVMLVISFILLLLINLLQRWTDRRGAV